MKASVVKTPILIATRTYWTLGRDDTRYKAIDRLWRMPCNRFELEETGGAPDDCTGRSAISLAAVFDWLQECPEQIERACVV